MYRETKNINECTAPFQASDRTLLMTAGNVTTIVEDTGTKKGCVRSAFGILKFFGWRGDAIVERPRKWRNNPGLLSTDGQQQSGWDWKFLLNISTQRTNGMF